MEYRYPLYELETPSEGELLKLARRQVNGTWDLEKDKYAMGPINPGTRVLIVYPMQQDLPILEVFKKAFIEKGATVDAVSEQEVFGWKTRPSFSSNRGWDELAFYPLCYDYRKFMEDSDAAADMKDIDYFIFGAERGTIRKYIEKLDKSYDVVFAGFAGWTHYKSSIGPSYRTYWPYTNYEYVRYVADYPAEVWNAADSRIRDLMTSVEEVHVTDAEGTDLTLTMSEEESRLWREEVQPTNHLFVYPRPPSFPEANGVVAGTSNHFGFYPHVTAHIKHGMVEKVEGGGKFGDIWRTYLDRYRSIDYPEFPSPGYYYIHEAGLATNPKGARLRKEMFDTPIIMTNASERGRAGVIHWGFGLQVLDFIERRRPFKDKYANAMKFAKEKELPYSHSAHIHNYFVTYEVRLRESKKWVRLIDKGWMTAFDDPEIRKIAAKYGNPDKIFKYAWVPAIPGITYEGNYLKDYGKDPISWIRKELNEIMPRRLVQIAEEEGSSIAPHAHEHTPPSGHSSPEAQH